MINIELRKLERQIRNGNWKANPKVKLWEGADVVVSPTMTDGLKQWCSVDRVVVDTNPEFQFGRQIIISNYSGEISTLFYQLKEIFKKHIDYSSKYEFFGRLASQARLQIEKADNEDVMFAIMEEAKRLAEEMEGIIYFAYGSNMDSSQMIQRCSSAKIFGRANLEGYRFIINKRGVASIVQDNKSVVEGLLWSIDSEDELKLDVYEGISSGFYYKTQLNVTDIVSGDEIDTLIYIASDNNIGKPRKGYLERIVNAAESHDISQEYIEFLKNSR